jgi:hypothetical protein
MKVGFIGFGNMAQALSSCRAMAILASRSASVISGFVSYKRNVLIVIRRDGLDIKFIPFSLNNRLVLYERNIFFYSTKF